MTAFDDNFGEVGPLLAEYFGGAVTYTDAAGSTTAISEASIGPEEAVEESNGSGGMTKKKRGRAVRILVSELATVQLRGKLTIDGVEYKIADVSSTPTFHTVKISRPEAMERSRPGYRAPR